jgi:hypothetical protein
MRVMREPSSKYDKIERIAFVILFLMLLFFYYLCANLLFF